MHEVQQLSGGARHAAVFTGKSCVFIFPRPAPGRFSTALIYRPHLECSKSTARSGDSEPSIRPYLPPPRRPVHLPAVAPSEGGETGEKTSLAANIGLRVKGGRPARATSDPSAGPPVAWPN